MLRKIFLRPAITGHLHGIVRSFGSAKKNPRNDLIFKKIFNDRLALTSLLQSVYGKTIESIEYLPTVIQGVSDERQTRFDIRVKETNGCVYIVEFEKAIMPGQVKRWLYYGAREYVEQGRLIHIAKKNHDMLNIASTNGTHKKTRSEADNHMHFYSQLLPVRTLVVYDAEAAGAKRTLNQWLPTPCVLSHIELVIRETGEAIEELSWTFLRLDLYIARFKLGQKISELRKVDSVVDNKVLMQWLKLLTVEEGEEVEESNASDEGVKRAWKILQTDLSPEQQLQYNLENQFGAELREAGYQNIAAAVAENTIATTISNAKSYLAEMRAEGREPSQEKLMRVFPLLSSEDAAAVLDTKIF